MRVPLNSTPPPRRPLTLAGRMGFSLIELLVVIAIIAVLASLVVPALPSLLGSQGLARAVGDVGGIFELARTEAVSRRTYVYLGFLNATNAFGNNELRIGAVASIDGTTNQATANLFPLTPLVKITDVKMTDGADLGPLASGVVNSVTGFSTGMNFTVGPQSFSSAPVVVISPQGEVVPSAGSVFYKPSADVGLVQTRGTTTVPGNAAVVTYRGGSGTIETRRP